MELHEELARRNDVLLAGCRDRPAFCAVAEAARDDPLLARFVGQDAELLQAAARLFAMAAAKSDGMPHVRTLYDVIGSALDRFDRLARFADGFDVDLNRQEPLPATQRYSDFLLRSAWLSGVDKMLAAVVPYMRIHASLTDAIREAGATDHPYAKPLGPDAGGASSGARTVQRLLDTLADDTPKVRHAYRYAVQCLDDLLGALSPEGVQAAG